jgi:dTDP-4-amino-4,6-dideoxygalactose transaminase
MKNIKFYDLPKNNSTYAKKFIKDFKAINSSGKYLIGNFVRKFEINFSQYCQSKFTVGVGNCLDAIKLSFMSLKIRGYLKDGDEVLVPANTYIASILGIIGANLKPVLVEPDENTFNLDSKNIEKKITKKTKAILVVDLYGHPSDLFGIKKISKKYNLKVVHDAAQSLGASIGKKKVGSFFDATCFSFFPGKNLGAFGDGGAITTNDKITYKILLSLRNYGEEPFDNLTNRKYINNYKGVNSRLDELQAAILLNKLKDFHLNQKKRHQIAKHYLENINNPKIILPYIAKNFNHSWHLFVIKCKDRNKLRGYLLKNKIETMIHYPKPAYKQPAFKEYNLKKFPITDKIYSEILSIPIFPTLKNTEIKHITKILNKF